MTTAQSAAPPSADADTQEIFEALLHAYANANNAGDSLAYSRLFTADAIWMPPGAEPEYGPQQIRTSVQPYFDDATWSARFTPVDALRVAERWIYGIADVDVTTTAHGDGARSSFGLTATWLLQRQASGEWLIARQMWNPKAETSPMRTASEIHRAMVHAAMSRDLDGLRAFYRDDDYTYTRPDGVERRGVDAAVEVFQTYTSAFPDFAVSIERQYQPADDVSIIEYRATGTHHAELDGIPATNRRVDFRGVNVVEIRDGRIVREREYYDNLAIMQQLGVAETPSTRHDAR
jgi:steroid delta-isomerase-like uncharacterized protein/uncharacterized protein (TIGR02246 family)